MLNFCSLKGGVYVRNVPYVVGYLQTSTLCTLAKYRISQGVQCGQTQDIRLLCSCDALSCDVNYTTNSLINSHTDWPKLCLLYGLHNFREEHKKTLRQANQNPSTGMTLKLANSSCDVNCRALQCISLVHFQFLFVIHQTKAGLIISTNGNTIFFKFSEDLDVIVINRSSAQRM
jgi:hypothetical protein